jgi:peptide deformylase
MSLLSIVNYPDPVLVTVAMPVLAEEFGPRLDSLVDDMFETMAAARGVGLAAPQVGVSKRLFVMNVPREGSEPARHVLVNPEIVHIEGEQTGEEGCLSFPGLYEVVKREMRVVVRAQDIRGREIEIDETELAARCILHETDHCDGIVFLNRMSVLKRKLAKRKISRLQKTGEWK